MCTNVDAHFQSRRSIALSDGQFANRCSTLLVIRGLRFQPVGRFNRQPYLCGGARIGWFKDMEEKYKDLAKLIGLPQEELGAQSLKFTDYVKVDAPFLRFVSGKRGKTRERIEYETQTKIVIPSQHEAKRGICVAVKGPSKENVDEAIFQIEDVIAEATGNPVLEYSHFISLPLAMHLSLAERVKEFQDSIRRSYGLCLEGEKDEEVKGVIANIDDSIIDLTKDKDDIGDDDTDQEGHGIKESIFIKPSTLHLTVLMLKLWNKERVAAATAVLEGLRLKLMDVLEHRPVAVRLTGVECMRGLPEKAYVLYAKVEEVDQGDRLKQACKLIIETFADAGLVLEKDKKQELKLHMTLMNTKRERENRKRFGKRKPFDARKILSEHGGVDWGEHTILEAHLSERFAYGEDGYYHCCGSIAFPALV